MTCEQVCRDSLAERYLASELPETEAEEFEKHFFACRRCFEELKTLRALEQELRALPEAPEVSSRLSWMAGWRWAWAAALLVAVIGAFVWTTGTRRRPAPVAQTPAPTSQAVPASAASEALTELARIEPPHYEESLLRGAGPQAGEAFRSAMTHYRSGEYERAAAGLRQASKADPNDPGSRFFLGICLLLTGDPEAGAQSLRDTIALGDSTYLEDARFYLAKALIGQSKVDLARQELAAVVAMRSDLEPEARKLLQKLSNAP